MATSILSTVKKSLGLVEDDTSFDTEVILFTNSVLATLNQIGVGPETGFQIEDAGATWDDLLGADSRLNFVQSYVHIKVKLLFDPPATSFAIKAMETIASELESRISTVREVDKWNTEQAALPPPPTEEW